MAGRDRRHGPRIGPGSLVLLVLVAIVASLVAIGLASDDGGGEGDEASAPETTESETKAAPPPEAGAARRACRCGSRPATPTYICVDRGAGTPVIFENTIDERADVPRQAAAREPRQARRAARMNGKPVEVTPGGRIRSASPSRRAGAASSRSASAPSCVVSGALSARAGIVVTGTEVLTGRIQDRNGPWLSDRLLELGVELAHITICGDRPEDIEAQLRFLADQDVDLILTSGGLGPTADDMTVEMVARFCERELVLDDELEEKIAAILKPLMARFSHWDFEAVRAANRKQALVPEGAYIIDPVGTAPGVVVPGKPTVVVLPGPPRELQPMWRTAVNTEAVQEAIAGPHDLPPGDGADVRPPGVRAGRHAARRRGGDRAASRGSRSPPACAAARSRWSRATSPRRPTSTRSSLALLRERHGRDIFSEDGSRVDDLVAQLLAGRRVATAESCTAGLLAARLTERPGSSAYVAGGVVAYANEAKVELLGVDPRLIEEHGAVSEPVAEAMAEGALRHFEADTAVAITGIAGPGRRDRGEAGGHRVLERAARGRARDHAHRAAAGRQGGHPRPLDHRRDAPAAAACSAE